MCNPRPGRPLRVALLIETDGPGGAETVLLHLARGLRAAGHYVVAVGPEGGEGWLSARFREDGVPWEAAPMGGVLDVALVRRLVRVFREHRVDVVHSHEFTMAFFGMVATRVARLPHVVTMHGGEYWATARKRRFALGRALVWSEAAVAVSRKARSVLCRELGLSEKAVRVIHNGLELRGGRGEGVRQELNVGSGGVLVVAVGNLYPVKGHEHLIRAVALLRDGTGPEGVPPVTVAVAGRGELEEPLRALAADLGVEDAVRLLGFRADIPDLLAAADVFVMPSLSEGLPMAVIEAMMAGRAVVATDVGGMRELIEPGVHGLLVPPADPGALAGALASLLGDASRRAALGEAARRRAEDEFSTSAMTRRYVDLFRETLGL